MSVTKTLSKDATAFDMPYVGKRSWILNLDDPSGTGSEAFFAIQAALSDPSLLGSVVIITGHKNNPFNYVHIPFNGAIIPICGIGFASGGTDIYGKVITTSNVSQVIAWGGNKVDRFI